MAPRIRRHVAIVLACASFVLLIVPGVAAANDVSSAIDWPGSSSFKMTLPTGHQVYAVPMQPGDWVLAYSVNSTSVAQPSPRNSIRILSPTATSVLSTPLQSSDTAGNVYVRATTSGTYYLDFVGGNASAAAVGMFTSRPSFGMLTAQSVVSAYHGDVSIRAHLSDALYDYVPSDHAAPALARVGNCFIQYSPNGSTGWKNIASGPFTTDSSGNVAFTVAPTVKTYYRWYFGGDLFGDAGFGAANSNEVVVAPRVALSQKQPTSARHGTTFTVSGSIKPSKSRTNLRVQYRRRGTSAVTTSGVRSASGGSYRTGVRIARKGIWQVRVYFKADSKNAKTYTNWKNITIK